MAFDRAKTSLQQIEDKLRNLFRLAGTIGATFEPNVTPVVIVGNTDEPGVADFRGRHFAWCSDVQGVGAAPASSVIGWKTPVDVQIHGLWVSCAAGAGFRTYAALQPPDVSPVPLSLTRVAAGSWIDRRSVTVDTTPFTDVGVWTAVTSAPAYAAMNAATFRIASWVYGAGSSSDGVIPIKLHVVAGSSIYWDTASMSGPAGFGLWGRIA